MMLPALFLSAIVAAEAPTAAKQSSDAIQAELPKAAGEDQAPPAAADLEKEMKKGQADGDAAQKDVLKPGEKKETKDWADEERWGRYQKEEGADGDAEKPERHRQRVKRNKEVGSEWPLVLRHRSAGGAFVLGAVVGFGAGHYYAGEANRGLMFSAIDLALIAGFVGTTVAMNQLVIDHDFKTGKSLARDERPMGHREGQLYVASVVLALAEVGSRVFQGIGALQAARRTNGVLEGVTFVPLDAGASLGVNLAF